MFLPKPKSLSQSSENQTTLSTGTPNNKQTKKRSMIPTVYTISIDFRLMKWIGEELCMHIYLEGGNK